MNEKRTLPAFLGLDVNYRMRSPEQLRGNNAMRVFREAVALARAGDHQQAREICAAVLFDILPMLRQRQELLLSLVHALLVAQGFKLLAQVATRLGSRPVVILLQLSDKGEAALPRGELDGRDVTFTIDPRWLARLTREDPFILGVCEALIRERVDFAVGTSSQTFLQGVKAL